MKRKISELIKQLFTGENEHCCPKLLECYKDMKCLEHKWRKSKLDCMDLAHYNALVRMHLQSHTDGRF